MNFKKKLTKRERKEKLNSLRTLDEQIAALSKKAHEVLETHGVDSAEYCSAIENLKALSEARSAIAETIPQRPKLDPTAFVVGGFSLASTGLLLLHDDEHSVPKWFHAGIEKLDKFLKK